MLQPSSQVALRRLQVSIPMKLDVKEDRPSPLVPAGKSVFQITVFLSRTFLVTRMNGGRGRRIKQGDALRRMRRESPLQSFLVYFQL